MLSSIVATHFPVSLYVNQKFSCIIISIFIMDKLSTIPAKLLLQ